MALHLDFDDQAGLDAYNKDDVHHDVAVYNASICRGEVTARVDWWYDGEPLITPGHVRHAAMFVWADEVDERRAERRPRCGQAARASCRWCSRLTIGTNVGTLKTDFDCIVDIQMRRPRRR